ncbi:MAG: hypothetical protein AAGI38_23700 [Bacteroidota bacterium]
MKPITTRSSFIGLLALIFLPLFVSAQAVSYTIRPGAGMPQLRLGASMNSVTGLMGNDYKLYDRAEFQEYLSEIVHSQDSFFYNMDFETAVRYDQEKERPYAAELLFFKENRLVGFYISMEGIKSRAKMDRYQLPTGTPLFMLKRTRLAYVDDGRYVKPDEIYCQCNGSGILNYVYRYDGISMVFEDGVLIGINLFKPFKADLNNK